MITSISGDAASRGNRSPDCTYDVSPERRRTGTTGVPILFERALVLSRIEALRRKITSRDKQVRTGKCIYR